MNTLKRTLGIGLLVVFILSSVAYKSNFFEIAKQLEIYTVLFKELNMYYIDEINPAELNEKAMKSMLKSLDPYTNFYDEQGIEDVLIKRSGEYGGIGAYTRYRDKRLFILETYKNAPSTKAGLKAGDEILAIDDIILKDYEGENVSSMLRGVPDSNVVLRVLRQEKEHSITIKRAKIEVNPVPFYTMVDAEVGYIAFIKFNTKASKEVRKAIVDLKKKGMKKLILDVRGNPGGLLSEAVSITNMFIPKDKVVVTTKSKVKKWSQTYTTRRAPLDLEIPLVVLVNGRSASASEIVAGSLQDYDRAVIMGERSFGKGLVQRYRKLAYGTQMKLTISKYYTPSGRCIQELDYANRDGSEIPKFSDGNVSVFKTTNGRKVTDGGGVLPDITVEKPKTLTLTKSLFKSEVLFNFVTDYYYSHANIEEPSRFQLEDTIFEAFKEYIIAHNDAFITSSEKQFEEAMKKATDEGYGSGLEPKYNAFLANVLQEKVSKLDSNKEEITEWLTAEIIKRYYFNEGVYQQKLSFDTVIVQATKLLHDEKSYQKLLR